MVVILFDEVSKWYPSSRHFSSHLSRGSKEVMNRYGLNMSPCMVSQLIWMGGVVVKCTPRKDVVDSM